MTFGDVVDGLCTPRAVRLDKMMGSVGRSGDTSPESDQDNRASVQPPTSPVLDRVIQARIGDKLRAMYGELAEQPVPDRLVAILDRLGKS